MSNLTSTDASYVSSTMEQYNSTTTMTNFVGTNASYFPSIKGEYNSTTTETNFTSTNATHAHSEEEYSKIFIGLSRVEEVTVWAAVSVGILAVVAVILRLIMPLVRKKHRKSKDAAKLKDAIKGSSSHLLESGTSSSSSRASTISGEMEFWNLNDSQKDLPTVSGSLEKHHKQSAYRNLGTEVSSFPVYLPKMKVVSVEVDTSSQKHLNDELSSILDTPVLQRLTSLNLSDDYSRNWQTTFDPECKFPERLRHVTQPPESRQLRVPVLIHQSSPKPEVGNQPDKEITVRF